MFIISSLFCIFLAASSIPSKFFNFKEELSSIALFPLFKSAVIYATFLA
nr:MAG TPA: hypothetical protein [Caudoviricetes sp.]